MLLSERLYSAAQIFLQYTMDTVICQGSLDISLLEWSAAEWNQADIRGSDEPVGVHDLQFAQDFAPVS